MRLSEKKEVQGLFSYPLFGALARVRSRRFAVGCQQESGALQYKSQSPPIPLTELEEALLCWAGAGVNGVIVNDLKPDVLGFPFLTLAGKTHPSACNIESTRLFFTNDKGVFLYNPRKASKDVEIETPEDYEKVVKFFEEDTLRISDSRLDPTAWGINLVNQWTCNRPGTTLFIPIVDITETYIGFLMSVIHFEKLRMIDHKTGQPAGVGKWIDNGTLTGPKYTIAMLENYAFTSAIAAAYIMTQNIRLAAEAMGLGCFPFNAFVSLILMGGTPRGKGLGFRFVTGKDRTPVPVGIDGVFESYCPPYHKDMDAAVDAFVQKKFGSGGILSAELAGMKKTEWNRMKAEYPPRYTDQSIQAAKDYCRYIFDTYGRFPATYENKVIPIMVQADHLDLGFYDKYFDKELVNETHRHHMDLWHK